MATNVFVLLNEDRKPLSLSPDTRMEALVTLKSPAIKVVKVLTFTGRDDLRDGSGLLSYGAGLFWPADSGLRFKGSVRFNAPKVKTVRGSADCVTLPRSKAETLRLTEAESMLLGDVYDVTLSLRYGAYQYRIAENTAKSGKFERAIEGEKWAYLLNGEIGGLRFVARFGSAEAEFTARNTGPNRYGLDPEPADKPAETEPAQPAEVTTLSPAEVNA